VFFGRKDGMTGVVSRQVRIAVSWKSEWEAIGRYIKTSDD
jgi:hypothetical protein